MGSRPVRRHATLVDVALTPALLRDPKRKLSVVIDLLRLTSAVVTMFGRGLAEALVVETPAKARREPLTRRGLLLCGEVGGRPPRGFDYGNSPAEFDELDLSGRRAVLATTNGSRALVRASAYPVVLAGSLLNITAVAGEALRLASRHRFDITVLCAGEERGRRFSLEDAFGAGALVEQLAAADARLQFDDSALAALAIYRAYRGNARAAFRDAAHARALEALGLGQDVEFCVQYDRFAVVPRLRRRADGALWLRG